MCESFDIEECCIEEWINFCVIKVKVVCGFCECGDGVCTK